MMIIITVMGIIIKMNKIIIIKPRISQNLILMKKIKKIDRKKILFINNAKKNENIKKNIFYIYYYYQDRYSS